MSEQNIHLSKEKVVCTVCEAECAVYMDADIAICPLHCPDHDYRNQRGEGNRCINCGQEPPADYYDED